MWTSEARKRPQARCMTYEALLFIADLDTLVLDLMDTASSGLHNVPST